MKLSLCLLVAAFLSVVSTLAFGAPFLVSDPYPAKDAKLSKFVVTIDGKTSDSTPAKSPAGDLYLKYDLGSLQDGAYTITIKAVDADGKESSAATYSFKKTGSQVEPYTPPEPKRKIPPSRSYPGHTNR